MCHALALGRRGHTWGRAAGMSAASPALSASHTHLLWWTKLWCSLTILAKAAGCLPNTGEREREEDLDRLAVSSTVHHGTDFLISAYFLPLDCLCIKLMFNFSLSQAGLPSGFENESLAPDVSLTRNVLSDTPSLQNRTLQRQVRNSTCKRLTARECFWWDRKMPLIPFYLRSKKKRFSTFTEICVVSQTYYSNICQVVGHFICEITFQVCFSTYNLKP